MGALLLVVRLALRDLRHNLAEALLLFAALGAAASMLTVALALRGVTDHPYEATRAATDGPDVVAASTSAHGPTAALRSLEHAPGVTAWSGPFLMADPTLAFGGHTDPVIAEARDSSGAAVDQPKLTSGHWVEGGGVVVERSLADLLGLRVGQRVKLGAYREAANSTAPAARTGPVGTGTGAAPSTPRAQTFVVTGIAVTAALLPSPFSTYAHPSGFPEAGLVWVTRPAAARLATETGGAFGYTLNLKLARPSEAPAFAAAHRVASGNGSVELIAWQSMASMDGLVVSIERAVLLTGSSLLALLALASVALLVGGRMERQTRRVGLLKAVGATPKLVTVVLLVEQLALAVVAAAAGIVAGWAAAPTLTNPGASLVGAPGAPDLGASTILLVLCAAAVVVVLATVVPAVRAARTSTVRALADSPRAPRRARLSTALSAGLPLPMLLGVRLAGRRRRRAVLSAASIAITVGTLVTVLMFRERAHSLSTGTMLYRFSGPGDPLWERGMDVMLVFTVALVLLALVNALLVTWATVQDARHATAVERALGASPQQVTLALVVCQLLAAVPGAVVGVPLGIVLYIAVGRHGATIPSPAGIAGVVVVTLAVVALLTAIPARAGARRPAAGVLSAELA